MIYTIKSSKGLLSYRRSYYFFGGNPVALFTTKKLAINMIKDLRQRYPERKYGKIHLSVATEDVLAMAVVDKLKG